MPPPLPAWQRRHALLEQRRCQQLVSDLQHDVRALEELACGGEQGRELAAEAAELAALGDVEGGGEGALPPPERQRQRHRGSTVFARRQREHVTLTCVLTKTFVPPYSEFSHVGSSFRAISIICSADPP